MSDEILQAPTPTKKKKFGKKLFGFFLFILILGLIGSSAYFGYQYYRLSKSPVAGQVQAEEEAQRMIKAVGKLMLLPKDETPTVATITDIEKLKDQPFFVNAKNGQKVLIYPNLKQVIVYDPESNMIINVGSVNFTDDGAKPSEQVEKAKPAKSVEPAQKPQE